MGVMLRPFGLRRNPRSSPPEFQVITDRSSASLQVQISARATLRSRSGNPRRSGRCREPARSCRPS